MPNVSPESRFDPTSLQSYLLLEPGGLPPIHEPGYTPGVLTPAAVLVLIVCRPRGATLLLTRRAAHLHDHPGQISFPGGRVDPEDVSPIQTALRETYEEIGLSIAQEQVLGFLPEYRTGTGFQVTPVVAWTNPPFTLALDSFEVAEAFEVPLDFLLNPNNHQQHQIPYKGAIRHFHAMQYEDYFIWGATAGMIVSLAERCGIVSPQF